MHDNKAHTKNIVPVRVEMEFYILFYIWRSPITWGDFYPKMDKELHPIESVKLVYCSVTKCQQWSR